MSCFRYTRAAAALAALVVSLFHVRAAHAEAAGQASSPPSQDSTRKLALGLRGVYMPSAYGGAGLGLDAAYYVHPQVGIGAEAMGFFIGLGDEYGRQCDYCVANGLAGLAFVEGRLFPQYYVSPYGRLGAGMGWLERRDEPHTAYDHRITGVFKGESGIDLHYGAASLRGFVFALPLLPIAFNEHPIVGFGFQLGVLL